METDVKFLIDKFRKAVVYQYKMETVTSLYFTETNAAALAGADARVDAAEAMLMAMVRTAKRSTLE